MDSRLKMNEGKNPEIPAEVRSLLGSLKVQNEFDYKKELQDRLSERFLNH